MGQLIRDLILQTVCLVRHLKRQQITIGQKYMRKLKLEHEHEHEHIHARIVRSNPVWKFVMRL